MRHTFGLILACLIAGSFSLSSRQLKAMENKIVLPPPQLKGKISLEQAISERRSKRRFSPQELTLVQISQLLWSAQGITDAQRGLRAAPSAGAIYPMEIYLLNADGLFHYLPQEHQLQLVLPKDLRKDLSAACLGQDFIAQAPLDIVIAALYQRVTARYGQRGELYTHIEVGHIAENVHLQAVALGLGSVPVGAFDEQAVKKVLALPDKEQPLYIIPVGYVK